MGSATSKLVSLALLVGATGLFVLGHPAEVRAQSSFFCPPGFSLLQSGSCVKRVGGPGAFSGAAVASQALSELSETTTQETTKNTIDAVTNRRAQEEQRCAEGFSRVDGTCQPIPKPVSAPVATPIVPAGPPEEHVLKTTKKPKAAAVARKEAEAAPKIVRRAPLPPPTLLPVPIEPGARFATWAQVYGDYEKRDATGPSFLNCCVQNRHIDHSLTLDLQSRTGTVGFLAGADVASRDLVFANDGLIAGVTAGYVSSDVTLNALTLSSNPGNRGGGSSRLHANLSGPTAGLYATYFDGQFSTDLTLRVDALTLDERFNDFLVTTPPENNNTILFQGNGSVPLLNATIAGNLNYRFDLYPNFWIEPTVGARYTNSSYGSNAFQLGLDDGNLVMVQGGARFGTTTLINNRILMTTTLTGLAYDDVLVAGGFIPAAAFAGQNLLVQADQGQVRGRGVLAFNFDFGQGVTSFVQGEARGGKGLFGAGGKAGVRVVW
ncbi:MAG: autotransporter outer membrane beta-barrel domain-containing protein [Pseudomonadota bacterium]|nr:autotransporter outer membrane beta-barrel domain-containing protein [Pseudomonadota bacterium]